MTLGWSHPGSLNILSFVLKHFLHTELRSWIPPQGICLAIISVRSQRKYEIPEGKLTKFPLKPSQETSVSVNLIVSVSTVPSEQFCIEKPVKRQLGTQVKTLLRLVGK